MINGVTLKKGATGITVTAGTDAIYVSDGLDVKNGIHIVDSSATSFITRPHMTFKNRPAALQFDGSWSKGRRDMNVTTPIVLASGKTSFPVYRGTFELHPEMTDAQLLELKLLAVQAIMDLELADFYKFGATA